MDGYVIDRQGGVQACVAQGSLGQQKWIKDSLLPIRRGLCKWDWMVGVGRVC